MAPSARSASASGKDFAMRAETLATHDFQSAEIRPQVEFAEGTRRIAQDYLQDGLCKAVVASSATCVGETELTIRRNARHARFLSVESRQQASL